MIYILKTQNDNGSYVDAFGLRWKVDIARGVYGAIVEDWRQFTSLEDALSEWGLVEYVDPNEDELSTDNDNENE